MSLVYQFLMMSVTRKALTLQSLNSFEISSCFLIQNTPPSSDFIESDFTMGRTISYVELLTLDQLEQDGWGMPCVKPPRLCIQDFHRCK